MDDTRPRFIRIETNISSDHALIFMDFLNSEEISVQKVQIKDHLRAKHIDHSVYLVQGLHSEEPVKKKSKQRRTVPPDNECLKKLLPLSYRVIDLTENVILYGGNKSTKPGVTRDLSAQGVAIGIEALECSAQQTHNTLNPRYTAIKQAKAKGVYVNASAPFFKGVQVPTLHPVFRRYQADTVSGMLNLEILMKFPFRKTSQLPVAHEDNARTAALLYHAEHMDNRHRPTRVIEEQPTETIRSALLVDGDKLLLSSALAMLLCDYLQKEFAMLNETHTKKWDDAEWRERKVSCDQLRYGLVAYLRQHLEDLTGESGSIYRWEGNPAEEDNMNVEG